MVSDNKAKVTLREITKETLRAILELEVSEQQKQFVASNAISIAEAYFSKNAWFRAIYADDTPVGFVMLYIDEAQAKYGLWRFMIAKNHQRKGYGYQALSQIIEYVRGLPGASVFSLSYMPGEGSPLRFYKKLGFVETDEWDYDEKVMRLSL